MVQSQAWSPTKDCKSAPRIKQLVNGWLSGRCRMSLEDHFRIQDVREGGIPKPKHGATRLAHMLK
jgi:hypothetical protein